MTEDRKKKRKRSTAGETIAETLVALLISSLALLMLAGAITSSAKAVQKSRDKMGAYYDLNEEESGVVKQAADGVTVTVTIKDTGDMEKIASRTVPVTGYVNQEFEKTPVISYQSAEE